jgi:hypothetical protein
MTSNELSSVDAVIDALGGDKAVAHLTGRTPSAPWNWRDRKMFPASTFIVLKSALVLKGHTAPDSLWKMNRVSA